MKKTLIMIFTVFVICVTVFAVFAADNKGYENKSENLQYTQNQSVPETTAAIEPTPGKYVNDIDDTEKEYCNKEYCNKEYCDKEYCDNEHNHYKEWTCEEKTCHHSEQHHSYNSVITNSAAEESVSYNIETEIFVSESKVEHHAEKVTECGREYNTVHGSHNIHSKHKSHHR